MPTLSTPTGTIWSIRPAMLSPLRKRELSRSKPIQTSTVTSAMAAVRPLAYQLAAPAITAPLLRWSALRRKPES